MFSDTIALTDVLGSHDYNLAFREGYSSIRREGSATSDQNSRLEIKHTIDMASTKPNRHLVVVSKTWTDSVTGEPEQVTAHVVITRAKGAEDENVVATVMRLASFLNVEANVEKLLVGEN